jgi:hypothetical protein
MNLGSSDAGACGTTIFWKHVGHSDTEPLWVESHFMCCPHTGHAYLNSLMPRQTFHIRAPAAMRILGEAVSPPRRQDTKPPRKCLCVPASLR